MTIISSVSVYVSLITYHLSLLKSLLANISKICAIHLTIDVMAVLMLLRLKRFVGNFMTPNSIHFSFDSASRPVGDENFS